MGEGVKMTGHCGLCGSSALEPLVSFKNTPVLCNELWPDADTATTAATGDIDLVLCLDCTLVANRSFDAKKLAYASSYENALHFSSRFQAFAETLCRDLIARFGLRGRDVVEIGCGDGFFLDMMVRQGARSATGFDPSMAGRETPFAANPAVTIVPTYFSGEALASAYDALLCRHVLEHFPDPLPALQEIRSAIQNLDCRIYFEVPNAEWMFSSFSIWDVIYEHVTYWSAPALRTLFKRCGLRPEQIAPAYGDQFLGIEARIDEPDPAFLPERGEAEPVIEAARAFGRATEVELADWEQRLTSLAQSDGRAVIWGAGSKGITFSNVVSAPKHSIAGLVDLNDRKHGRYTPVNGLPVVGPGDIGALDPSLVLIANALYADEIRAMVRSANLSPDFKVIAG